MSTCRNCEATLTGPYCAACGQKSLGENDRRFVALLAGIIAELTAVDSRFWRSLTALLFKPGKLSHEYLAGRRQRYVAPIALFLLANAIYFLSPALSDFDLSLGDQVRQTHSHWTRPLLDSLLAHRGQTLDQFEPTYMIASGNVGKLLLIIHVPFMALALMLLSWRRHLYYSEHFVVALHIFTFLLVYVQLFGLLWMLGVAHVVDPRWIKLVLPVLSLVYATLACRRAYAMSYFMAPVAGFAVLATMLASNLYVYRTLQFLVSIAIA